MKLQTVYRRHIPFNPADAEHRAAYWVLSKEGKQDPELRFVLEERFGSVLTMMQAKIADHFSEPEPAPAATVVVVTLRQRA